MRTAIALWLLTALWLLRVLRQAMVELLHVRFLRLSDDWFFGRLPYPAVLTVQVLILILMVKINLDFTRRSGWSYRPRVHAGRWLLVCGGALLAAMVLRDVVRLTYDSNGRWTASAIPIVVHRLIAVYVLILGWHHGRTRISPIAAEPGTRWASRQQFLGPLAGTAIVAASVAPWPRLQSAALLKTSPTSEAPLSRLSFRDDAATAGLSFRYFAGVNGPPTHRMFEFTGGGVGILDFDLDGWPDVFFTQGRNWPPETADTVHGDRLYRNRGGERFDDATVAAGIVESGFGQGVTVGDYDADGFPDAYVANIGANVLWKNNGDGTFTDATAQVGLNGTEWTTSCLLADLTGDGLPDLYDVNYLMGDDVFTRVCPVLGVPTTCQLDSFDAQPDRFWRNEGDGRFHDATLETLGLEPDGKGLGVAAWDAFGVGRLSLLVTNDTTPNFFFTNDSTGEASLRLRECGIETGLAYNGKGQATGSMGAALGDVDDDGRLDILITNFHNESNTLFLNRTTGSFEDRTRELGLQAPSLNMLGFGTQFLDADLDGRLELFVANGHVDDVSRFGRPYRMPPQLFRNDGRTGFVEVPADEMGPYFQAKWLGRAVARLDWNRDGREDLIVGHLDNDAALLTNTTGGGGRLLSLKLIGGPSNREAIGTTVRARIGEQTIVRQLTAGDGYHCSNERRIVLGAGAASEINEIEVHWPSGTVQRFSQVPVSREVILREGGELLEQSREE
ncbi:MAG TPA: CRTAC1 family protein [Planctomycetaceae bacterium]|nr:CRTAC1 family protein [Planctomycetaceae bacterium]